MTEQHLTAVPIATEPYAGDAGSLMKNTGASLFGHAVSLVVPLLTVPYLARVLRPEGWEPVLVAQSLAAWITLVLDFGFELTGTRAVARARANPGALPLVVSGVQSGKLMLIVVVFALLTIAVATVPGALPDSKLLGWVFLYAAARGLNPFWFFQGLERLREAVLVETATKVIAAGAVFLVVSSPAHGSRVLALQALFAVVSLLILTRKMHTTVRVPSLSVRGGAEALRDAAGIFTLRASSGLYNQANAFVLSQLTAQPAVAFFGGAERIVRAAVSLLQPVSQALFPRLSYLQATAPDVARRDVRRYLAIIGGVGTLLALAAMAGAPLLVRLLLGAGYEPSVPVIRVLAPLPFLTGIGTVLGLYWAVPFGHERTFVRIVVGAGLFNLALALTLAPRFGAVGMAASVVATEALVTTLLTILYLSRERGDRAPSTP